MKARQLLRLLCCTILCSSAHAQTNNDAQDAPRETIFVLGGYGITGNPTETYRELTELVRTGGQATLFQWLHSDNPVMQMYALEGYKRLDVALDDTTRNRITIILENNATVFVAQGCMVSLSSTSEIARQNSYYSLLKK